MNAEAQQSVVEVLVAGELDAAAVPEVRTTLYEALAGQPGVLVVDLARCPVIDAVGIALLLDVHRRAWMADGRLTLRSPTPHVQRILEIARVAHILSVEPKLPRPEAAKVGGAGAS
ncbi:MAG TPA: STAS domain-containing protein [Actinoplanes sp.]|jgi:anti-anti-sigma factor